MVNLEVIKSVKRLVSLLFFVLVAGTEANSAEVLVKSVHSFSGHGDFVMIGNVNYNFDAAPSNSNQELNNPLKEIDLDQDETTTNSSGGSFCIKGPFCPEDKILYAGLTWSGKVLDENNLDWKKVKFSVNGSEYEDVVSERDTITEEFNSNVDNKGIYVCHAQVTKYFTSIDLGTDWNVMVANIVTEKGEDRNIPTKFGGWTLTVIYKQKLKEAVQIHYYPLNVFEPSGGNGLNGDDIVMHLALEEKYNGIGDALLGMTTVGGALQATSEGVYVASDSDFSLSDRTSENYELETSYQNYLNNSITMRRGCADNNNVDAEPFDSTIPYSRGYDLHVHRFEPVFDNGGLKFTRLAQGDSVLNLYMRGSVEHHMIADVVVMTGIAQKPKIEAVQTGRDSANCIIYTVDVNTKENVEDLRNFVLDVELPDYTVEIKNISISGSLIDRVIANNENTAIGVNATSSYKYPGNSTRQDTVNGWYRITSLNSENYVSSIAKRANTNYNNLTFSYSGVIPRDLEGNKALTFTFEAWIDEEMYINKAKLTGGKTEVVSQSRLDVVGSESGDSSFCYSGPSSLLDLMQNCDELYGFGGGGGLDGGGLDGGSDDGGSGVNNPPLRIGKYFDFSCSNIPDTVHLDGCAGACVDTSIIKELLLKEYNFDVDANAKEDSLNWLIVKRDSIVDLCQLAITDRIRRGEANNNIVFCDSANWMEMKRYWEAQPDLEVPDVKGNLYKIFRKDAVDSTYIVDEIFPKIKAIIERPVNLSHLDMYLSHNTDWENDDVTCIRIKNEVYPVLYVTPYNRVEDGGETPTRVTCIDTLYVSVREEIVPKPRLFNGKKLIADGDTVQYCLEATIDTFTLIKKKKNYDLEPIDSTAKMSFLEYELLSDTVYRYVPKMETDEKAIDSFKIVQKNNTGCPGDTFTFFIEILDVKPALKPTLPTDSIVCWVDESLKDSVVLSVTNTAVVDSMRGEGFDLAWYLIDDINHNDSLLVRDVTSINIPKDSVGRFGYGVTFYYLGCETEMDTFVLDVNALPKKLTAPEISFCQYVEADSAFVAGKVVRSNSLENINSMLWFPAKSAQFTSEDAISLSSHLSDFNYSEAGVKQLIVAPQSEFGCIGDTTLVSIEVIETDSSATKFIGSADSLLLCVGDDVAPLHGSIDVVLYDKNAKWYWFEKGQKTPVNTLEGLKLGTSKFMPTNAMENPRYDTERPFTKDYQVVRVDSNSCASRPSDFKLIVGDSIHSTPFIGDTVTLDYTGTAKLIELCAGEHPFNKDVLPVKASVNGFSMEAVKKDNITDDCDTTRKYTPKWFEWNNKKNDEITLPVEKVGVSFYCIRQQTPVGCYGPWVNITILVHDSLTEKPTVEAVELCQMDNSLEVSKFVTNPTQYNVHYYDAEKNKIDISEAVIETDEPGEFLSDLKNNLFYVSLYDAETKCESKLVGLDVTIHQKPQRPIVTKDSLYYCMDNQTVDLAQASGTTIYPSDKHTKLVWVDSESLVADKRKQEDYFVHQMDTISGCVSEQDTVTIFVEKTFDYVPFDSVTVCYGESIDLWTKVVNAITYNRTVITTADPQFSIQQLLGTTPQAKLTEAEASQIVSLKQPTEESVQRYLITIYDEVSGCHQTDTAQIRFKALPKLEKIDPVTKCQEEEFVLPTPDSDYRFVWQFSDGTIIVDSTHFSLYESDVLTLVATTEDMPFCVDSTHFTININEVPELPLVSDITLCQGTGKHSIPYEKVGSAENPVENIVFMWRNESGEIIPQYDTEKSFDGKSLKENLFGVVSNTYTKCESSKEITVTMLQAITLGIDDPAPLCQPETFDAATYIQQYVSSEAMAIGGNEPVITDFYSMEGETVKMSADEMSSLSFSKNADAVKYAYKMSDVQGVCSTIDTFVVTIHPKPAQPLIEKGEDSLFYCQDNVPLVVVASDTSFAKNRKLVWQNGVTGLEYTLDAALPTQNLQAYFKDTVTSCESEMSEVVAVVASPIVTRPIGGSDTLVYCAGEVVDLWSMGYNSFVADLKHRSSFVVSSVKKGVYNVPQSVLETLTSTVQDTSTYLFEVMDTLTKCTATNLVTVIFHQLPDFMIEGETAICDNGSIALNVAGDERPISYEWYYGDVLQSTSQQYRQTGLTVDTTLRIVGSLQDLPRCKTEVSHFIDVMPNPEKLQEMQIDVCQDTAGAPIAVNFNRDSHSIGAYSIRWFNEQGDTLQMEENLMQEITEEGVYLYRAELIDKNTLCVGQKSTMTVKVNPQIRIHWNDPDTICQPFTYNLMEALSKAVYGGTNPRYQYTLSGGDTISNETAIAENSMLKVYYKDDNGCELVQPVSVQFFKQPQTPTLVGDTIVCQSIGDVYLSAKKNGTNTLHQTFQWKAKSSERLGDSLALSTENFGTTDYELLSVDTLTHCYSEPTSFTFDVRKKISYSPVGLLESCYNVPVDLPNKVEANYLGSDEEKHFAYFSISPTGSVSSLSQPDNILKSGNYLVKVSEKESKCERMDTVAIVVYDSLAVSVEGTTVICQESVVPDLKALNAETYIWRRANGIVSEGSEFPFADAVAESETFRLIGEKKMGTLFCQDSIDVMITVNENPQSLMDTSIVFCQDSTATAQPISMNRSTENIAGFSIGWYDSDDNLLSTEEEITVSINKSGIQNYQVRLTNRTTGCVSKPTKVEVKVNPQIVIDWTDPDTICPPNTFNLIENLSKSVWGGTHPIYQFTTFGNEKIANETAIDKSGIYTVHYTDDNGCDMSYKVNIQFFDRPAAPTFTADTTVCQGIGEVVVSASKNGVNTLQQTFEWTSPNAVFVGDELAISTDHYGVTAYEVRAIDTLSHCTSEPVVFNFDVRQKIGYHNIGLMESCYNVPVDLKSVAEKAYFGNPEEKLLSYLKISNNGNVLGVADPSQILTSGRYVVRVNETESGCFRADTVEVAVYDSIGVSVEGPLTICQGDEVEGLVGVNADTYTWRRAGSELESEVFPFATSVAQSETFRLIGEKKIGTLYCQDSIDVNITVNLNPQTLPDTVLQFCQFEGGADASVKLDKLAREGESLQLVWLDGAEPVSSPNDELKLSVQNDTAFTYYFKQVNTLTKCESKLSKAAVTIYPQIRVALQDTTTCDPNVIDLVNLAKNRAEAEEMTPMIQAQQYFLLEHGLKSDVTSMADRLVKSGVYEVVYSYQVDDLVCTGSGGVQLTFNRQPQKPVIADQSYCQNSGDQVPVGKSSADNLRLIWEDLSSYPSRVDTLQTVVSTAIAGEKEYLVRQIQDLSGCVSENALVKIHVYPSIHATDQDTSVCFGSMVDLNGLAERNYHGGTEKFSFTTKNKEGQRYSALEVDRSGGYYVYYADSANVCHDTAEIHIHVDDPISLTFDAPASVCSGEEFSIHVSGADTYLWSTGEKRNVINVATTIMEDKVFSVTATRAFRDVYCYADSSIVVPVYESVRPMSLTFDTCYGNPIYLEDVVNKYAITEQVDTIKNITDGLVYSTVHQDLSKSGEYELYVSNRYGCKAVFPLTITSHKVENLLLTYQQTPYCYGDSANFKVSSDNAAKYEWISLEDDAWSFEGEEYDEPLMQSGTFLLIATENKMGCKDTTRFDVSVYEPYEIEITGESNACAGNPINLEIHNYLSQIKWQLEDTTIVGEKSINLIAENTQAYTVSGVDKNNCPVHKNGVIQVAHLQKPKISVENTTIENPDYQLDRENLQVSFYETTTPNGSSLYTYYWDFGFGITEEQNGNNMVYNTYTEEQIRPNKDIEVKLLVRHEFGCEKSDTAYLKIDPNLFVPNTMYQDGEYRFMEGYDLQIFDRVGTLIYEGSDGWDGTYKGSPATEDTYFYALTYYINGEKQIKTGYITLVY